MREWPPYPVQRLRRCFPVPLAQKRAPSAERTLFRYFLIQLCAGGDVGIHHQQMELFFAVFVMHGGDQHAAGVDAHHLARGQVDDGDSSKVEIEPLFADQVDFDTFSKSDFRAVKIKACEAVKKSKKLLQFVLDDGTGEDRIILSGIHEYYEPEELVGKTAIAIVNLPPRKMMGLESCGMLLSAVHTEKGEEVLNLIMVDDKIPAGAKLC